MTTLPPDDLPADASPAPELAGADAPGTDEGEQLAFDVHAVPGGLPAALEAVLMVIDEPVTAATLAAAVQVPTAQVESTLHELERGYAEDHRGFALRAVEGRWRFYSRPTYAAVIERVLLDGQRAKLTHAALETLAVIAYRQPVSRSRVSSVRGVNVDSVIRTLLSRDLIAEVGHDPATGAILYGTTHQFLERLGLASLDDLPALAPYLPDVDLLDDIVERGRA